MNRPQTLMPWAVAVLVVACPGPVKRASAAQRPDSFQLLQPVVASGFVTHSAGGGFTLAGSAGQIATTTAHGDSFILVSGVWSQPPTGPVPPAPSLRISVSGPRATLSWPITAEGFQLEETDNLTTGLWLPTTGVQRVTATEHVVVVPLTDGGRLFRLRKP